MGEAKPWYQSKTILANLTALATWILTLAVTAAEAGELPNELAPYAVLIVLVGNLLLRMVTTQPIVPPIIGARLLLILACLLLPSIATAASPKAIIDGPSSVRVAGQKLVLRASETTLATAKGFQWRINPEVKGMEQLTVLDGGKAVMVHTIPGHYVVTMMVAGAPDADGRIEIDSGTHDLIVPGEAPCPPPEPKPVVPDVPIPVPTPTPRPQPVVPIPVPVPGPDTMGVRAGVISASKATGDPAGCIVLAAKADTIATRLRTNITERARAAALGVAGPDAIAIQSLIPEVAAAIKALGEKWEAFVVLTGKELKRLFDDKRLSLENAASFATFLEEVASALREGARQ